MQLRVGESHDLELGLGPATPESPEEHVKKTYIRVTPQSKSTKLVCLEVELKDLHFK